jgi:Ca2+-binding EF-hand superfamily protein
LSYSTTNFSTSEKSNVADLPLPIGHTVFAPPVLVAECGGPLDALVGDKATVMDNYENRLREMSAPEKVFGYFASVTREDGQQYMTVADFLRSITPFWSAGEGDGDLVRLERFRYLKMADVDGDGLISFDEYIVFITLLSIPVRDFEIAFNMFDLDRNGTLDIGEFRRVLKIMRDKNPFGRAQLTSQVENSGLIEHFFGADGAGALRFETFSGFLHGLRGEILEAKFEHVARGRTQITAAEFGQFAVSYARTRYLPRLKARLASGAPIAGQVSFEDFRNFHKLLERMDKLEAAMHLMLKKGEGFSRDDFSRAAEVVVGVPQAPVVIDVLYRIFDDNDDDHLSPDEFVSVMRYTATMGLQKPRDTGVTRAFECAWSCFRDEI